jgi:hypothetical protein
MLLGKVYEMLEACIQKLFAFHGLQEFVMMIVGVTMHPEEPFEYIPNLDVEMFRKYMRSGLWKKSFIIKFVFNPRHEQLNVIRSRYSDRSRYNGTIGPFVSVLGSCSHGRAIRISTLYLHIAKDDVELIEEVHGMHSQPFVDVDGGWTLNEAFDVVYI